MIPQNVRLDKFERNALVYALEGLDVEVYLFGSRINPDKKGGDIDLLVYSSEKSLELSMQIRRRFFLECEEKIDVLVMDKNNLTEEQKNFISTIDIVKIK